MTFHMPSSWYEPPTAHECDDGPDCDCEERARDEHETALQHRADEEAGR